MASALTVKSMDKALHAYYSSMGQGDTYVNDDGVGKFEAYCDDNGLEDEDVADQFDPSNSAEDCLFIDFDDEYFPLPPKVANDDYSAREQYIWEILLRCKDGEMFQSKQFDQDSFDAVSEKDIEQTVNLYKKYCPAIFNRDMGDDSILLFMLGFQCKHGVYYLANLLDSYNRYRIEQGATDATVHEWARLRDNKHFCTTMSKIKLRVSGKQCTYAEWAVSCMHSFHTRCCPALKFGGLPILIDDSLEQTANYVSAAAEFVSNMTKSGAKQAITVPFQFDVAIAVGAPQRYDPGQGNDEDDDDDDDDEWDDDDEDKQDEFKDARYHDWIADVKKKLNANGLKYSYLDESDQRRVIPILFRRFLVENNIGEVNDKKHYLANKRLIVLIDRRASKKRNDKNDDVFMYEPPPGPYTRDIPTNAFVPEWHVSASRTSILPNVGYDEEMVIGNKARDDQVKGHHFVPGAVNIGAADHCHAGLITLSFCVYSEDKIKLYLYWNGGMIRMLPRDLMLVLPRIFVESKANTDYAKSQELKQLVKDLEAKLPDKDFADWMEAYPIPQNQK